MSPIVGGRSEVINTPFVDCLGYLIADFETQEQKANEEKQRLYLDHISRMLAKPESKEAEKQNKKFMKEINPDNKETLGEPKQHEMVGNQKLEWDSLEKLKALENR